MKDRDLNSRPVFMLGDIPEGRVILIGIPDACREKLVDGNSHAIDLTKVGLPFKLLIYGAKDHDAAVNILHDYAKQNNLPVLDERRKDFG